MCKNVKSIDDSDTEINVIAKEEEAKVKIQDNQIVLESTDKDKYRIDAAATFGNSMTLGLSQMDLMLEILMNMNLKNQDQFDYVIGVK